MRNDALMTLMAEEIARRRAAQAAVAMPSAAQAAMQRLAMPGYTQNAPVEAGTWAKIGSAAQSMLGNIGGGLGFMAEQAGLPGAAGALAGFQYDQARRAQEALGGGYLDPEKHWEEQGFSWPWVRDLVLTNVPQIAPSIAGGLLGSLAGPVGAMAGAMGMGGASAGLQMGGQLHAEGTPAPYVWGGMAGSAIANTVLGLNPAVGRSIAGVASQAAGRVFDKAGKEVAAKSAVRRFLEPMLKVAGGEAASEAVDTLIEEGAKNIREGKDFMDLSSEQLRNIGYGAFAGATIGSIMGGPFELASRRGQRTGDAGFRVGDRSQWSADSIPDGTTPIPTPATTPFMSPGELGGVVKQYKAASDIATTRSLTDRKRTTDQLQLANEWGKLEAANAIRQENIRQVQIETERKRQRALDDQIRRMQRESDRAMEWAAGPEGQQTRAEQLAPQVLQQTSQVLQSQQQLRQQPRQGPSELAEALRRGPRPPALDVNSILQQMQQPGQMIPATTQEMLAQRPTQTPVQAEPSTVLDAAAINRLFQVQQQLRSRAQSADVREAAAATATAPTNLGKARTNIGDARKALRQIDPSMLEGLPTVREKDRNITPAIIAQHRQRAEALREVNPTAAALFDNIVANMEYINSRPRRGEGEQRRPLPSADALTGQAWREAYTPVNRMQAMAEQQAGVGMPTEMMTPPSVVDPMVRPQPGIQQEMRQAYQQIEEGTRSPDAPLSPEAEMTLNALRDPEYQLLPLAEGVTPDASVKPTTVQMGSNASITTTPVQDSSRTDKAIAEANRGLFDLGQMRVREFANALSSTWEWVKENVGNALQPLYEMDLSRRRDGSHTWNSEVYMPMEQVSNKTSAAQIEAKEQYWEPVIMAISELAKTNKLDGKVATAMCNDFLEWNQKLAINAHFRRKTNGELNAHSGETDTQLRQKLAKLEAYDFSELKIAMAAMNEYTLTLLGSRNVMTQEQLKNYRTAYPDSYVPLRVDMDSISTNLNESWYNSNNRKSLSTPTATTKFAHRIKGKAAGTPVLDPIAAATLKMYDAIALDNKIEVHHALLRAVATDPTMVADPTSTNPKYFRLVRRGDESQARTLDIDDQTGEVSFPKRASDVQTPANTISVMDPSGRIQQVEFSDPKVAQAFKSENVAQLVSGLRWMRSAGNFQKKLLTSKSPLFWLRNPARDTWEAMLNTFSLKKTFEDIVDIDSSKIASALFNRGAEDLLSLRPGQHSSVRSAIYKIERDGWAKFMADPKISQDIKDYMSDYPNFMADGAKSSFFSDSMIDQINKTTEAAVKDKNPVTKAQKARKILNWVDDWSDAVSDSLENKTRYIVYKEVLNQIRAGTFAPDGAQRAKGDINGRIVSDAEIRLRAANAALNITINFSKKGALANYLDTAYWFAGANIAGNIRMMHTVLNRDINGKVDWSNVAKFAAGPAFARLGLAMIARELMGEDDDGVNFYDKIPSYVKATNMILPNPFGDEGSYAKIPIAYGFSIFWELGRIGEAVQAALLGKPAESVQDAAMGAFMSTFDNFNILGENEEGLGMFIPSILRPFYQWGNNKAWTGAPIMPEGTNAYTGANIPDSERYWSTASKPVIELCRWLNEATGGSEARSGLIDWSPETLKHFSTAYTGGMGRVLTSLMGRMIEMAEGQAPDLTQFAGANVFLDRVRDQNSNFLFTKYRDAIQTAINENKIAELNTTMPYERRQEILERNAPAFALKDRMNMIQKQINDLRQQERKLQRAGASADALDALNASKHRLRKQLISAATKAGIEIDW